MKNNYTLQESSKGLVRVYTDGIIEPTSVSREDDEDHNAEMADKVVSIDLNQLAHIDRRTGDEVLTPTDLLKIYQQTENIYMNIIPEISGDSGEYELLTEAVELSKDVEGMCCEIGTRRGLSLKYIIDAVRANCHDKTVISIDPYGSILYQGREGQICRLDYTNQMKYECMAAIYAYLCEHPVDFHFFDIEDTVFFEERQFGVHKYDLEHTLLQKYSMVFFDGPHYVEGIIREMEFFLHRTNIGGIWTFDDTTPDFYDHTIIHTWLLEYGFELVKQGVKKANYRKMVFA